MDKKNIDDQKKDIDDQKKSINYLRPILILAMVLLALYVGTRLGKMSGGPKIFSFSTTKQNNLSTVIDYISKYYVDSIAIDSLAASRIPDLLKELDPHSVYIPAAELAKSNEHLEGNFEGIGVTFYMLNDTVVIINVIQGGPSSKAGVNPGDRIIEVGDFNIAGKNIDRDTIVSILRGKAGSKVQIKVKRTGLASLLPIDITRGTVTLKSIDIAYMINPNTGYVRITNFAKSTYSEFIYTINSLHSQGMTNLILDLRDNLGGLLDQVSAITGELFSERSLLVYTEGRASPRYDIFSEGEGKCGKDNIVVLINEHSASASEILAGAVQDNDRGIIVGRRSFGKGLVQTMIELPDKSSLRLTISRYYTPSGRSIQKHYGHGSKETDEYFGDLSRRYAAGEYTNVDSIKLADSTKYYTMGGRVVYGGGGIMPDVFVPYERPDDYVFDISRKNLIYGYAVSFADKHRKALNSITNVEQLEEFLEKNNPYYGFNDYLNKAGVKGSAEEIKNSEKTLTLMIKAYVGQATSLDQLGSGFFYNRFDKIIQTAIDIFNEGSIADRLGQKQASELKTE
ncbi:MAG: S41 family peptidase [Prevotellaceae bacterium]|jgi:carboxyl-terminal processing protease|nr:S41 family peptidase [Prevotellaceae bacterium]